MPILTCTIAIMYYIYIVCTYICRYQNVTIRASSLRKSGICTCAHTFSYLLAYIIVHYKYLQQSCVYDNKQSAIYPKL